MKKSFCLIAALLLCCACSAPQAASGSPQQTASASEAKNEPQQATSSPALGTETESQQAASSVFSKEKTEDEPEYTDENGLLTKAAAVRFQAVYEQNFTDTKGMFTGFYDFDLDGVPELYIVFHSGGQGEMPVHIYQPDGTEMGVFYGYCRDGFCRLSQGEDCVYVHNRWEHSMHLSSENVSKITVRDGKYLCEEILSRDSAADDRFPLKETFYHSDGSTTDAESYFSAYNDWLFEENAMTREANEVSLCSDETDHNIQAAVDLYNQYVTGKNAAKKLFGKEPLIFAFDDYDGDGTYEAFTEADESSSIYFWNGTDFTEIENSHTGGNYVFTRLGGLFFAQPFGNGLPCKIYGVRDGEYYEHENSDCAMLVHTNDTLSFSLDINANYILYQSDWDSVTIGGTYSGGHTHKPYFFEYPCEEIIGVPVTKADLADRADILAALDELETEQIMEMYLRGECYLNVNYTVPAEAENVFYNRYKTYLIQNQVTLIDEGEGHYSESVHTKKAAQ